MKKINIILAIIITLCSCLFVNNPIILKANTSFSLTTISTHTSSYSELSHISTINNQSFVFLNSVDTSVVITNKTSTKKITATNDGNTSFVRPISCIQMYSEKYAVIDILNVIGRIIIYDSELNFENLCNVVTRQGEEPTTLGVDIPSACVDYYGNAYILDRTNNSIVKYSPTAENEEKLSEYLKISNFTLDSTSKIKCNISGSIICISNSNSIMIRTGETYTVLELDYTITDFAMDCSGNLFTLENSQTQTILHKINNITQTEISSFELNELFYEIYIEQENGKLYLFNETKLTLLNSEGFVANLLTFEAPVDFEKVEYLSDNVTIIKTNKQANLLSNPYSLTNYITIESDTLLILLSSTVENNLNFSYCYYQTRDTYYLGYILKSSYDEVSSNNTEKQLKTYQTAYVYKYPTMDSPVLSIEDKNTVFDSILVENYTDQANHSYYIVNTSDGIGYIKTKDLIDTQLFEATPVEDTFVYPSEEPFAFILIIVSISLLFAISLYYINVKYKDE